MTGPENPIGNTSQRAPGDETDPGTKQTGEAPCPRCGGSGNIDEKPCPDCEGSGTVTVIVGDA